jgi:hypothetical protein
VSQNRLQGRLEVAVLGEPHVFIPDMIEAVLLTCADLAQQASEQRI